MILFSESEGAFAELGAFCTDALIRERLIVVVSRRHYEAKSFISLGPLKLLDSDDGNDTSVCVVEANNPAEFKAEVHVVGEMLQERHDAAPKTTTFRKDRVRDKLLLVADLVELFGALKVMELEALLAAFSVESKGKELKRALSLLCMFQLVRVVAYGGSRFYVAPAVNRSSYIDYVGAHGRPPFDRPRTKIRFFELLKADSARKKAYETIHGKV